MKLQKAKGMAGPSSSIGLMRFFDTEMAGPKISPEFALILTTVIVVLVLVMRFIG